MLVQVEVSHLSVHLQCWSGGWCVCPPRQISKSRSDRGVTERVTVFMIRVNAACFQVRTSGFLLVVRLPLLAASQKGSSLPRLVGVQHYTQTHTRAHTHRAWSSSVLQPCPVAESQITVRPLSRCSAVFLKTREEKRENKTEREREMSLNQPPESDRAVSRCIKFIYASPTCPHIP